MQGSPHPSVRRVRVDVKVPVQTEGGAELGVGEATFDLSIPDVVEGHAFDTLPDGAELSFTRQLSHRGTTAPFEFRIPVGVLRSCDRVDYRLARVLVLEPTTLEEVTGSDGGTRLRRTYTDLAPCPPAVKRRVVTFSDGRRATIEDEPSD